MAETPVFDLAVADRRIAEAHVALRGVSVVRGGLPLYADEHPVLSAAWHARLAADPAGALAAVIDHTLLKPDAGPEAVTALCAEAERAGFASVCVNGAFVEIARRTIDLYAVPDHRRPVKVCAVVGFPLGAMGTAAKAFETAECVRAGADEIDMVLPVGLLKARLYKLVAADIAAVVQAAGRTPVKVILETALLTDDEKVRACMLAERAGAAFVKTSTGFAAGGAAAADVALMRRTVGDRLGVKASGGVRDRAGALAMIAAGANRLGCSSSLAIVAPAAAGTNVDATPRGEY